MCNDTSDSALQQTTLSPARYFPSSMWGGSITLVRDCDGLLHSEGSGRSSVAQMRVDDRTCNITEVLVPSATPCIRDVNTADVNQCSRVQDRNLTFGWDISRIRSIGYRSIHKRVSILIHSCCVDCQPCWDERCCHMVLVQLVVLIDYVEWVPELNG